MKSLPEYHVSNHCVIGKKSFTNILIGPGKLHGPGKLRRRGSLENHTRFKTLVVKIYTRFHTKTTKKTGQCKMQTADWG